MKNILITILLLAFFFSCKGQDFMLEKGFFFDGFVGVANTKFHNVSRSRISSRWGPMAGSKIGNKWYLKTTENSALGFNAVWLRLNANLTFQALSLSASTAIGFTYIQKFSKNIGIEVNGNAGIALLFVDKVYFPPFFSANAKYRWKRFAVGLDISFIPYEKGHAFTQCITVGFKI